MEANTRWRAVNARRNSRLMCGRYKLTVPFSEIVQLYNLTNSVNLRPRYKIAPTQDVLAVIYDAETKRRWGEMFRWGLVPF